jgi:ferric-dicitrate binding protein FerR (iron transport regulator)
MKIPPKIRKALRNPHLDPDTKKKLLKSSFSEEMMRTQWANATEQKHPGQQEPDYEKIWLRIEDMTRTSHSSPSFTIRAAQKYAAILIFGVFSYLLGTYMAGKNADDQSLQMAETPAGAISEIRLPDNSKLWLNARSSVKYDSKFGISHRNLEITGEAYFEVAENDQLPFVAEVMGNKVTALGTEFYITAYPYNNTFSAGLLSGSIEVQTKEGLIGLDKPEALTFQLNDGTLVSRGEPEPSHYEWKNGKLIFNNTALKELAYRLSNWYNHHIEVDEDVKTQKFTLTIEDENIEEVLELIELASDLNYKSDSQGYLIY